MTRLPQPKTSKRMLRERLKKLKLRNGELTQIVLVLRAKIMDHSTINVKNERNADEVNIMVNGDSR